MLNFSSPNGENVQYVGKTHMLQHIKNEFQEGQITTHDAQNSLPPKHRQKLDWLDYLMRKYCL